VDIRVAVPQDLQEIIRIERASFEHEAYSKALLDAFLQEDAFLTLVAEDDAIIAYATMYHEKKEGGVRVVSIAVLPEERNQGIAKRLMRWISGLRWKGGRGG
jgi:ribosomal protein S18 acetylase RimI-like enzyme